jgi:hypothetical protein
MESEFDYRRAYTKLHRKSDQIFSGRSLLPHVISIGECIAATKSKKLLDYGSGKGAQYYEHRVHEDWGVPIPYLYDVGLPAFRSFPDGETFDGVICTDVLEHIHERDLPSIVRQVFMAADKFVFLSISTVNAKKEFKDGTNVHLTVRPRDWWRRHIQQWYPEEKRENNLLIRIVYAGDS